MKTERASEALRRAIAESERAHREAEDGLQEAYVETAEALQPVNLLRKAVAQATGSGLGETKLGEAVTGLVSGYLARKVLFRNTTSTWARTAAWAVQGAVTQWAGRHAGTALDWLRQWLSAESTEPGSNGLASESEEAGR